MSARGDSDDDDDGYAGTQFQADDECDDGVRVYYDSLTPEISGSSLFDQRLETFHQGIDMPFILRLGTIRYSRPSSIPRSCLGARSSSARSFDCSN
mmetsp:Transcript_26466/g.44189  ORF Transcript_26466/g.44189 Transcript_26466/m.44189 type:complete len:96 (-) Transcript_26466:10-297(-)